MQIPFLADGVYDITNIERMSWYELDGEDALQQDAAMADFVSKYPMAVFATTIDLCCCFVLERVPPVVRYQDGLGDHIITVR